MSKDKKKPLPQSSPAQPPGEVVREKYPERSTRKDAKGFAAKVDALAKEKNITRAAAAAQLRHEAKLQENPSELEPRTDDTIADSAATETPKHES